MHRGAGGWQGTGQVGTAGGQKQQRSQTHGSRKNERQGAVPHVLP